MQLDPNNLFHYIIKAAVDWRFRVKTVPVILIKSGLALIILSVGGWISFGVETSFLTFNFSDAATPAIMLWAVFLLGALSFVIGAILGTKNYLNETNRKKTVVIEQRGLKFAPDTPLKEATAKRRIGKIEEITCDIRQRMDNGIITAPEDALRRIINLPVELESKYNNVDSHDLRIIYGGLMAVPFTFLTGMLIDDESNLVEVFDWDRNAKKWRELDGVDDQERFNISGLNNLQNTEDVILAISTSYTVDFESVKTTLGDLPIVHLELSSGGTDIHWSRIKQTELCREFSDALFKLKSLGIKQLHIFVAAPNSLCFNLGRQYDARNFPDARIYQYEQSSTPPFPWSVELPTHGKTAQIIFSNKQP